MVDSQPHLPRTFPHVHPVIVGGPHTVVAGVIARRWAGGREVGRRERGGVGKHLLHVYTCIYTSSALLSSSLFYILCM